MLSISSGSFTINQASTTTDVTATPNPVVYGQDVTFTATVAASSPGSGTPTGTVQFEIDGVDYGSPVPLDNGQDNGQASISDSGLSVGDHVVTALYTGDANFMSSSDANPVDLTVNQDSTTTTFATSANALVYGQEVTFNATVSSNSPGTGTPTGTVTFADGTTVLGTG